MNSIYFQNLKIWQIFLFLWSLKYKVFETENLHIDRTQFCYIQIFLKLLNSIFKFLKKLM
jgi:hypothetical protein